MHIVSLVFFLKSDLTCLPDERRCILYVYSEKTYYEARKTCAELTGYLWIPSDNWVNNFFNANNNSAWISFWSTQKLTIFGQLFISSYCYQLLQKWTF